MIYCGKHGDTMEQTHTQYGTRWQCVVPDCTVVCWDGSTSTPADAETRQLRQKCHLAFDPLWRSKGRFKRRKDAYRWLKQVTGGIGHIGYLDAEQCRNLLSILEAEK